MKVLFYTKLHILTFETVLALRWTRKPQSQSLLLSLSKPPDFSISHAFNHIARQTSSEFPDF